MVICQPVVQWKIDVKLQRFMLLQIVISALKLLLGFCEGRVREDSFEEVTLRPTGEEEQAREEGGRGSLL